MVEQMITWIEELKKHFKWSNSRLLPFAHITMEHVFLQLWMVALSTERT